MPADRNALLARSTSDGSPPAAMYRTPPRVRKNVASAARILTSQPVALFTTVGRSATINTAVVIAR
jgi:hypothetical protein